MIRALWLYAALSPILFCLIVIVLSFNSVGYNQISQTISQLVNYQYGYIQQCNFIQLGIAFGVAGYVLARSARTDKLRKMWRVLFYGCAIFIFTLVIFPTDEMAQFSAGKVTSSGLVHYGMLMLFFLIAPMGVLWLSRILKQDASTTKLVKITEIIGFSACILCYLFVVLFVTGIYSGYLGLLQKTIFIICLVWYEVVLWSVRPTLDR